MTWSDFGYATKCGADLNGDNLRINRAYLRISDYCSVAVTVKVKVRASIGG